jgi:hypothetical protein
LRTAHGIRSAVAFDAFAVRGDGCRRGSQEPGRGTES